MQIPRILNTLTSTHWHESLTLNAKHYESEPVVYQNKNTKRNGYNNGNLKKTRFKQVQTTKILVTLDNLLDAKHCMGVLFP